MNRISLCSPKFKGSLFAYRLWRLLLEFPHFLLDTRLWEARPGWPACFWQEFESGPLSLWSLFGLFFSILWLLIFSLLLPYYWWHRLSDAIFCFSQKCLNLLVIIFKECLRCNCRVEEACSSSEGWKLSQCDQESSWTACPCLPSSSLPGKLGLWS